jgi:AcrR family transcriptional regulator
MTRVAARGGEKTEKTAAEKPAAPAPAPAPLRADAARNRQRILAAAEEVFSGKGMAVPIDVVAERAGLGIGTLYRHFPTKEALVTAIVTDRFERLVRELEPISETEDPRAALVLFVERLGAQFAMKKDLMDALGAAPTTNYGDRMVCAKRDLHVVLDKILERGREAGCVRADVTGDDVFRMVHCVYSADGIDSESRSRYVGVICDGLRALVTSRPPAPSPRPTGPRRGSAR